MAIVPERIKVLFIAGFGPVVADCEKSRRLYRDVLGLPLEAMDGNPDYLHTGKLDGVKHFASWPLAQASISCFGTERWPQDKPAPQCWLELEVENVADATAVLKAEGYTLLVENRLEPWGQTVTRFLDPEGVLLGITYTPWLRE